MRKFFKGAALASIAGVVFICNAVGAQLDKPVKPNDILSQEAIKSLFDGYKISGKTINGSEISYEFIDLGHKSYIYSRHMDKLGNIIKSDRGEWWLKEDQICRKLKSDKLRCSFVQKQGDFFAFIDQKNRVSYRFSVAEKIGSANVKTTASKKKTIASSSSDILKVWRTKNANAIGQQVGYSELCSEYRGNGAPSLLIRSIKYYFDNNTDFERGYQKLAIYSVHDSIDRLDKCNVINESLEKIGGIIESQS